MGDLKSDLGVKMGEFEWREGEVGEAKGRGRRLSGGPAPLACFGAVNSITEPRLAALNCPTLGMVMHRPCRMV